MKKILTTTLTGMGLLVIVVLFNICRMFKFPTWLWKWWRDETHENFWEYTDWWKD